MTATGSSAPAISAIFRLRRCLARLSRLGWPRADRAAEEIVRGLRLPWTIPAAATLLGVGLLPTADLPELVAGSHP